MLAAASVTKLIFVKVHEEHSRTLTIIMMEQGHQIIEVDARGLEPPQPLVTILEAVSTLPAGAQIWARTDRRPMHLYTQLAQRGFMGESEAQEDGSFITRIRRVEA